MALVILTDRCTLSCDTCFRPRGTDQDAPWLFGELDECLAAIAAAGHTSVFYSGGEPSLWSDGEIGFAELLAATARHGLSPAFATNGWAFRSYEEASALLGRYFERTKQRLYVVVSVDHWHEGSWVDGRSPALDALLQWQRGHAASAHLEVELASLCCRDHTRNIPPKDFAPYADAGVKIGYPPLSPRGRARELRQLAPTLCPSGTSKESLGPYGELLRAKMDLSPDEWRRLDNVQLLGPCHAVTTITLGMDRHYWLCCDRARDRLRVAVVGGLTQAAIEACLARNPVVRAFRESGVVQTLRQCARGSGLIERRAAEAALAGYHPYGISGRAECGVCSCLSSGLFS